MAEAGSQKIIELVERTEDRERSISALAMVEVRSAVRRRERAGEIAPAHAITAITQLTEESRRLIEQPVTSAVLARASEMVDRHALRALDALQLASALIARETMTASEQTTFVCADSKLLHAAKLEGLEIWNPED